MPRPKPWSVCNEPGCPELVKGARCPAHERASSANYRWVYSSPMWRGLKRQVRQEQPFCLCGCQTVWIDLDHLVPLAAGGEPFARHNVEGRCKRSHSRKTAGETWHDDPMG
jgi:hypothetical protein